MVPLFCILFLAIGQSLATPQANQYVDTVLHTALQNVIRNEKLEPTHLPDYTYEYKDKTVFGKVNGKAEYTEGKLSGLSRIMRYSECDGPRNVSGSTYINCTLTFNQLNTSYKGKVKYGVLPKKSIDAKGGVEHTIVDVAIGRSLWGGNAQIKKFSFRSIGTMKTDFSGLGPLNNQMKDLQENYKQRVGAEVTNVVGNRFQYALNLAVAQVPMPTH